MNEVKYNKIGNSNTNAQNKTRIRSPIHCTFKSLSLKTTERTDERANEKETCIRI